jgi:hypothetical protein
MSRYRTEWGDEAIYTRPLSEDEHRSGWAWPRYFYVAPRTADDQALDAALAWYASIDWRTREPPPLPESEPLPPTPPEDDEPP